MLEGFTIIRIPLPLAAPTRRHRTGPTWTPAASVRVLGFHPASRRDAAVAAAGWRPRLPRPRRRLPIMKAFLTEGHTFESRPGRCPRIRRLRGASISRLLLPRRHDLVQSRHAAGVPAGHRRAHRWLSLRHELPAVRTRGHLRLRTLFGHEGCVSFGFVCGTAAAGVYRHARPFMLESVQVHAREQVYGLNATFQRRFRRRAAEPEVLLCPPPVIGEATCVALSFFFYTAL